LLTLSEFLLVELKFYNDRVVDLKKMFEVLTKYLSTEFWDSLDKAGKELKRMTDIGITAATAQFTILKTTLGNLIDAIFGWIGKIGGSGSKPSPDGPHQGDGYNGRYPEGHPNYSSGGQQQGPGLTTSAGGYGEDPYDRLMGLMSSPYKMRNGANYGGSMVASRQSAVNMTNVFQISAHDEEGSKRLKYMLDDSAQQAIQRLVDAGSRATSDA
jgi:hypothetical protein